MLELLNQIISRADRGEVLAVCTLVQARGSTPQKPGAMMLVLADGKTLGTIGGGCVEAEVRTRALRLMASPVDRLLSFKLDHDLGWDDGLVCGGTIDVAVQIVISPDHAANYRLTRDQLAQCTPANLLLTALDEQNNPAQFSVTIEPSPTLIIAGAGHVGGALASIARQLDFQILVVDDRVDLLVQDRFPGATLRVGNVEEELSKLHLNQQSYVVIVTRGHRNDASALSAVVRSQARYIGLIGSRRKIIRIFSDLSAAGVSTEQLSRVHAPVGLDIGAVTPGEIAVSIAAELIMMRRNATATPVMPMHLTRAQVKRTAAVSRRD